MLGGLRARVTPTADNQVRQDGGLHMAMQAELSVERGQSGGTLTQGFSIIRQRRCLKVARSRLQTDEQVACMVRSVGAAVGVDTIVQ